MGTAVLPLASSRSGLLDSGPLLRFWDSFCALLPNSSAFASLLGPFQTSDLDGAVSWGKVVFLTSCFIIMAGCGILTRLLRRKDRKPSPDTRRRRRSPRKDYSKTSAGTVTSSEEEDDYSNGSLRHSSDSMSKKGVSTHHYEQTGDG